MEQIKTQEQFNELLEKALAGSYNAQGILKEAISTSDIPTFFNRLVNAEIENQYPTYEPTWTEYATKVELNDFRPTAFYELLPDSSMLRRNNAGVNMPAGLPRVPELTPYPTFEFKSSEKFVQTAKHGARVHFSFEAFVNDAWDQIASLPGELTYLARQTEDVLAALMLVNANGVNTANFNAENDNILRARSTPTLGDVVGENSATPDNAPLSLDALFAAIQQTKEQKVNGNSVRVNKFVLAVPPSLTQYANLLVNAAVVKQTVGGREFTVSNPLPAQIKVVEIPWLTDLNEQAWANTAWFLLPAGGRTDNGRRTIVETFLRGRETPEMRVNTDTGKYLGGGDVDYTEGSFDNDDAQVRLRHIVGSGFLNPGGTIFSKGDGSAIA